MNMCESTSSNFLTTWFYIPLVIAFLMSIYRMYAVRQVEWKAGSLCEVGAAFLICSFCSVINSLDKIFSIFNWFFLPCMYAILYMLIVSYLDTIKKKKKLLLCFLGAAAAVAGYGIWQYIHIDYMIAHVINQEWVDTKEFPHLYRRMYSTLENPNLCATYFLIVISYVGAFFLFEKEIKNKVKNNEDLDGNIVKNAYEIRLRLTKRGMLLANDVFVEFILSKNLNFKGVPLST